MCTNLESEMFSGLIQTLKQNDDKYANIQDSKSLLVVHEEKLFAWHCAVSCVLAVDLSCTIDEGNGCKMLLPTNPPVFEVECLLFNRTGTLLALYGEKGLMVMQVPRFSSSSGHQNNIFCRSWHIAERFFICANEISLLQVSWHPGSSACTHLTVLSSDNYLRIYDATDSQTPLQVISLNQGRGYISSEFRVSFPECYGETPVSFDFGPAESAKPSSSSAKAAAATGASKEADVVHPVYVLYGNGDVYVVRTVLRKNGFQPASIDGPIPMYPPSEDNYGIDACSILCLHTTPTILVISMASGILYHCILLDNSAETNEQEPWLPSDSVNAENDVALYVHGSVELPMSPTSNESNEDNPSYSVRLYKDVAYQNRYHCSVVSGVYTVIIPFVQKLEECVMRGDVENLSSILTHNDSIVEHLLCTKPLPSAQAVPILGLASFFGKNGLNLICLLASWDIQNLPLLSSYSTKAPSLLSCDPSISSEPESGDRSGESFEDHIRRMLQRSVCTPILKMNQFMDGREGNAQQLQELVSCTVIKLRQEYIENLYLVHSYIQSRIKVLTERKVQQMNELNMCLEEKEQLRNKAESLAEKYDDVNVNQQVLMSRIEKVLKALQHQFPVLSSAELDMKQKLTSMETKIKVFQSSLDQIKKKVKFYDEKLQEKDNASSVEALRTKLQSMNLGEVQQKHLKEILFQEGKHISSLVKTVTSLKKDVMT